MPDRLFDTGYLSLVVEMKALADQSDLTCCLILIIVVAAQHWHCYCTTPNRCPAYNEEMLRRMYCGAGIIFLLDNDDF